MYLCLVIADKLCYDAGYKTWSKDISAIYHGKQHVVTPRFKQES